MNPGYVYILINSSMPGLIKIGKTLRDSRERAHELWTTGIPTPFQVAFETFSQNYDELETLIHNQLSDFRVSNNREFFRFPLDKAISLLQDLNSSPSYKDSIFSTEDITDKLKRKYPKYLKQDIVAFRIVQSKEIVWLEITQDRQRRTDLKDQVITRTDLGFICEGNHRLCFEPNNHVSTNADKFVNKFDP